MSVTRRGSVQDEKYYGNVRYGNLAIVYLSHVTATNGCETWSLTLREERRLKVFENRMLKRVFGPKRDEVIGEWRKLHN
jgi:hypothetical protein